MEIRRTNTEIAWWLLYLTYGLAPIVVGADKFFDSLTNWSQYLYMAIPGFVGITASQLLMLVGVIEILAGLLVLFKPRLGAYVVSLWFVVICVNLVLIGRNTPTMVPYYDVVLRDLGLAVGAFVLALLSRDLNKTGCCGK